jgi:TRAP-type C4-dicarboxylate transport system permease small subunit
MLIWGGDLVLRTWGHVIPSLGLPRGLAYLGMPIAGLLIFLFSLERVLEEAKGVAVEDEEDPRWS